MSSRSRALLILAAALSPSHGCGPLPAVRNELVTYSPGDSVLVKGDAGFDTTLQVHWLGTASYLIQLGQVALLTDPFFSYQDFFGRIESDPEAVHRRTHKLAKPRAIFIGHSHYDHMLDLAETIRQREWFDVPTYGSETTKNILCGYGDDFQTYCRNNFREADVDGEAHAVDASGSLKYRAYVSEHAPQIDGILLYRGEVLRPRNTPPKRASDFPVGTTYTYLFDFSSEASDNTSRFTVYFAGSASSPRHGLPAAPFSVDVAILSVSGWKNVDDYPAGFLQRLAPRHVVPSHYNNFFQEYTCQETLVPAADLDGFLRATRLATTYSEFERIILPGVDTVVHFAQR